MHLQLAVWAVLDKQRGNADEGKLLELLSAALAAALEGAERHGSLGCLVRTQLPPAAAGPAAQSPLAGHAVFALPCM